jgi:hypothetical protein
LSLIGCTSFRLQDDVRSLIMAREDRDLRFVAANRRAEAVIS